MQFYVRDGKSYNCATYGCVIFFSGWIYAKSYVFFVTKWVLKHFCIYISWHWYHLVKSCGHKLWLCKNVRLSTSDCGAKEPIENIDWLKSTSLTPFSRLH